MEYLVTVDSESTESGPIDPRFFGANLLFDRDDLDGTFADKIEDMNTALLRFPGGGIAEDSFDITNPDAIAVAGMENYETFSDFMAYCIANNLTPAIVIPTKRYLNDIAQGEADVATFVNDVTSGVYGAVGDVIFEIGNEYYATTLGNTPISDSEYGEIAGRFAVAIDNAAQTDVTIAVQSGRTAAKNQRVMDEFDTQEEIDAISAVIVHQYPWAFDAIEARFAKTVTRLQEWEDHGVNGISFMSEWNIGSDTDDTTDDLHDYGLSQNPALLELVYHAVVSGIDFGAVWGIQQSTKTSLGRNEGNPNLLAAGVLYQMVAEVLPDKTALVSSTNLTASDPVVTYAYHDDDEIAVFVAARDFDDASGPMTVDIDLTGIGADFVSVEAVKISTDDPVLQPRVDPVVTTYSPDLIVEDMNPVVRVTFDKDYEVIRLLFARPSSVADDTTQHGSQTDDILTGGIGDDVLKGRDGVDFLSAHDGDDELRGGGQGDQIIGGGGNDLLFGGSGHDRIEGNSGNDTMNGGAGRDTMTGGTGNDQINGGVGRDYIYGGDGDDILNGDAGRDRLWGGDGADTFVFTGSFDVDRIYSFEVGTDTIDLTAIASVSSFADVTAATAMVDSNTVITLTEGTIILRNFDISLLAADDFLF